MCLSIYLFIYIFIYLSIYIFIYLSIYLFIYLSICSSIYPSVISIHFSINLSMYLSKCLWISTSINLIICVYTYLFIYLSCSQRRLERRVRCTLVVVTAVRMIRVYLNYSSRKMMKKLCSKNRCSNNLNNRCSNNLKSQPWTPTQKAPRLNLLSRRGPSGEE